MKMSTPNPLWYNCSKELKSVECGKRLFRDDALQNRRQRGTFSCCFGRCLGVGSCLDYTSKYTANKGLASSLYWNLAPLPLTRMTQTKANPLVNKKQKGKTCRHRKLILFFNSKLKPSTLVLRYGSANVYKKRQTHITNVF